MSKPKNYLILSLSGIGNYLMHTSVFHAIKTHEPNATITVWVPPRHQATLAKTNPDIDCVIKAPIKRSIFGHFAQVVKLRRLNTDTALVLFPGQRWKSALYLVLSGAHECVGHRYLHLGNPDSSLLLTTSAPVQPSLHDIEQNQSLLQILSIPSPPDLKPYYLTIPARHERQAALLLGKIRRPSTAARVLIGLHPGSAPDFSWKRWPLDNFARTARYLIKHANAQILIFGGQQEITHMKSLRRLIGTQHASIVTSNLLTVAATIKQCRLFISNDSGLMHVASALSVPTIGLFGPTDEQRTGPRGPGSQSLRAPDTSPVYNVDTNYSLGTTSHPTMQSITSQQVQALATEMLH